jgi:ubiquinone/menaquinone biosynthesis C-methylase UbiE
LRLLTPDRIYEEELLDAGVGTDDDVARNLADLRRINRLLGGTRVVLKALAADIDRGGQRDISLLDVGTGSADIPATVLDWCKARGVSAQVAALDLSERNLRIAGARLGISPEINLLRADALQLPFARRSFDYVTASLFLHHFRDDDVARLLADFARVARRAVIVNDLVRNLVPYYFMKITGPLLATSFLTRSDGPVSVLRGFTAEDFHRLAAAAGLRRFRVERVFPYRLSLVAEPDS